MRVLEHFTDTGYKCAGCNYTAFRWYAFDTDSKFEIEKVDGRPNWCCMDCMMSYILDYCKVEVINETPYKGT